MSNGNLDCFGHPEVNRTVYHATFHTACGCVRSEAFSSDPGDEYHVPLLGARFSEIDPKNPMLPRRVFRLVEREEVPGPSIHVFLTYKEVVP